MTFILPDGTLVPDSDPRAIRARGARGAGAGTGRSGGARGAVSGSARSGIRNAGRGSGRGGRTNFGTIHGSSQGGTASQRGGSAQTNDEPGDVPLGPLRSVARAVGIEHSTVTVPALFGSPATKVPLIHIFVVALLGYLVSWRIAIAAVILFFVYNHRRRQNN